MKPNDILAIMAALADTEAFTPELEKVYRYPKSNISKKERNRKKKARKQARQSRKRNRK